MRASLGNCVVSNPTTPSPPLSFSFCLISLSLIRWWLSIFRRKLGVQVQPHIFPSFPLNATTHKRNPTKNGRFIRAPSPTLKARVCKGSIVIFKRIRFSLRAKVHVYPLLFETSPLYSF
ncbi:hypothetical protein NC652_026647 [Populus alba x Populus x berolinensis]|nr:hypothetical protein NC652_026647 [Populus alba x Populus x berolinensis]